MLIIMRIKFISTVLIFVSLTLSYKVSATTQPDNSKLRSLFLQVEKDIKLGRMNSFREHQATLVNYSLFPYLKYGILSRNLSTLKLNELENFIETYHDCPLAEKLRTEWLRDQAKKNGWHNFIKGYVPNKDIEMQCNFIYSYMMAEEKADVMKYIPEIWLSGDNRPRSCELVFNEWKKKGGMTESMLWKRIKMAISSNNIKLARKLSNELNDLDRKMVELWVRVNDNPSLIGKTHYFTQNHPVITEILVHGISKISSTDPKQALALWKELSLKHNFNKRHQGVVLREIALSMASNHDPEALTWLSEVPQEFATDRVYDLRLRLSLAQGKWRSIPKLYKDLPERLQHLDKWKYWYARAQNNLGETSLASRILETIVGKRSYYGFLASLRLSRPYNLNVQKFKASPQDLARIEKFPCITRAFELKLLNRDTEANREWSKSIELLNEQDRHSSAKLANDKGYPNWAISALSGAANNNDLDIRFPKHYSEYILRESQRNMLDPAVVYAITRQESAFVHKARSSAGAMGLMQVMPSTARLVARKHNILFRHHLELYNPEKNIMIGTKYFREMLNQHQMNAALAAAAYNAGPNRVTRWLPQKDTATDVWVETIPFSETRSYVQNILTYTIIYQQLMNQKPSLKEYMPIISGLVSLNQKNPKD
jgi:soluble lytic murein transglycosylase